jgi:hypothetical protein
LLRDAINIFPGDSDKSTLWRPLVVEAVVDRDRQIVTLNMLIGFQHLTKVALPDLQFAITVITHFRNW